MNSFCDSESACLCSLCCSVFSVCTCSGLCSGVFGVLCLGTVMLCSVFGSGVVYLFSVWASQLSKSCPDDDI